MRQFETGATRDDEEGKLDYEGFSSPLVERRFAEYMHEHRKQADGKLRDSDNWQKGIPITAYMKSMKRHVEDFWLMHRRYIAGEDIDDKAMQDLLCAIRFNVNGYLHELLVDQPGGCRLLPPEKIQPAKGFAAIAEWERVGILTQESTKPSPRTPVINQDADGF